MIAANNHYADNYDNNVKVINKLANQTFLQKNTKKPQETQHENRLENRKTGCRSQDQTSHWEYRRLQTPEGELKTILEDRE
jgi:hypothetical protein